MASRRATSHVWIMAVVVAVAIVVAENGRLCMADDKPVDDNGNVDHNEDNKGLMQEIHDKAESWFNKISGKWVMNEDAQEETSGHAIDAGSGHSLETSGHDLGETGHAVDSGLPLFAGGAGAGAGAEQSEDLDDNEEPPSEASSGDSAAEAPYGRSNIAKPAQAGPTSYISAVAAGDSYRSRMIADPDSHGHD